MALPKVCGIENEFGFVILDKNGHQVIEDYGELASGFVESFLRQYKATRYGRFKESPLNSFLDVDEPDETAETLEEILHRLRLKFLSWRVDGFLYNGARFYLDDTHPEYCTPEFLSPLDGVAHDKASELFLMNAQKIFIENIGKKLDYRVLVHKNNSDGRGNSYGCHLNVLLAKDLVATSSAFRYLVRSYIPFQIARLVLIGGGKVGAENNSPDCRFQISQRADFFERVIGVGTTAIRPIFNTRNEPHADYREFFRLHDISTDSLMCESAIFLKIALAQIVLSMIEDEFFSENWYPEKPVEAIKIVSRDLKFCNPIKLENGESITGLELLRKILLLAGKYLNEKPMTAQHNLAVRYALKLLDKLEKDPRLTFGKLDWTTAWKTMEASSELSAAAKVLKFREVSQDGLYYRWRKSGKIPGLLKNSDIVGAMSKAPENTRAHLRSLLMKKYKQKIRDMDWSCVVVEDKINLPRRIDLDNPFLDKEYYKSLLSELES